MSANDASRWRLAQLNLTILENCEGPHQFEPIYDQPSISAQEDVQTLLPARPQAMRCSKCQGVLSNDTWFWYQKGLEHGRRTTGS